VINRLIGLNEILARLLRYGKAKLINIKDELDLRMENIIPPTFANVFDIFL
jgi:hypothetical protein